MMSKEARISPFCNGSQDADWQNKNCVHCEKFDPDNQKSTCEIDQALLMACFDDGTVTAEIAERMGYTADAYCWECKEIQLRSE